MKEFQFTNPHSWLLVDVTDPDGVAAVEVLVNGEVQSRDEFGQVWLVADDYDPGEEVVVQVLLVEGLED